MDTTGLLCGYINATSTPRPKNRIRPRPRAIADSRGLLWAVLGCVRFPVYVGKGRTPRSARELPFKSLDQLRAFRIDPPHRRANLMRPQLRGVDLHGLDQRRA